MMLVNGLATTGFFTEKITAGAVGYKQYRYTPLYQVYRCIQCFTIAIIHQVSCSTVLIISINTEAPAKVSGHVRSHNAIFETEISLFLKAFFFGMATYNLINKYPMHLLHHVIIW